MSLRLDWCSYKAAKYAVEHWHYSRKMPRSKNVYIGVWEGDGFIGVLVFGLGAGSATNGERFGLKRYFEVAELERVALRKHEAPVSRIVAIALRMLRHHCPGLKAVVSFADPHYGHIGAIYQAGNWLYLGQAASTKAYIDSGGNEHHSRHVNEMGFEYHWGKAIPCVRPSECVVQMRPGKHRYLWCIDPAVRLHMANSVQPYPKRAASIDSDAASSHQEAEGGANPTAALQ